jgi:hypothetical protein
VQPGGLTNFSRIATNSLGGATSAVVGVTVVADPSAPYPQAVLAANPAGYWRLNEGPDNGAGNDGVIADDCWGGDNGLYTNTILAQAGYNPTTDPTETSAEFGFISISDCDADGIAGVDFSAPANSSAPFSVEAWVNGYPQSRVLAEMNTPRWSISAFPGMVRASAPKGAF